MDRHPAEVAQIHDGRHRSFDASANDMKDDVLVVGRALGHPVRLALLRAVGDDGLSLSKAAAVVGVSVSSACRHLGKLVAARMVVKHYRGREAIYKLGKIRWTLAATRAPDAPR